MLINDLYCLGNPIGTADGLSVPVLDYFHMNLTSLQELIGSTQRLKFARIVSTGSEGTFQFQN